jgi:hypothetical protein
VAYDAAIREIAAEITGRLSDLPMPSPPLERQRAVGTASPVASDLFIVGSDTDTAPNSSVADEAEEETNIAETTTAPMDVDEEDAGEATEETKEGEDSEEDTNTAESTVPMDVDESEESEESSADESNGEEPRQERVLAPVDVTNTSGVSLSLHRQDHTGHLAMGVEAPIWMWVFLFGMVTAYLWLIIVFFVQVVSRSN